MDNPLNGIMNPFIIQYTCTLIMELWNYAIMDNYGQNYYII